jgi:hypothetical protein
LICIFICTPICTKILLLQKVGVTGLDQGEGSQGQEAPVGSSDGGVAAAAQRHHY